MLTDKTGSFRLRLWVCAAVTAPLAHYAGAGYMAAALAAGAMLPLSLLAGAGLRSIGKGLAVLEWVWTAAVLAHLLPASGDYWPSEGANLAVPLLLGVLAALSGDGERAARACSSLFWLAVLMLAGIILAAVSNLNSNWLSPQPGKWSGELVTVLLLPGLAAALGDLPGKGVGTAFSLGLTAVILGVILQGTLSQGVAVECSAPFYELGRSLEGVGYEPLTSVAMTIGWYCLCVLMYRAAVSFLEKCGLQDGYARLVTLFAVIGMMLLDLKIHERALMGISLLLWILVPMLAPKNKMKKSEKRC